MHDCVVLLYLYFVLCGPAHSQQFRHADIDSGGTNGKADEVMHMFQQTTVAITFDCLLTIQPYYRQTLV